jgi:hypothetical protein
MSLMRKKEKYSLRNRVLRLLRNYKRVIEEWDKRVLGLIGLFAGIRVILEMIHYSGSKTFISILPMF